MSSTNNTFALSQVQLDALSTVAYNGSVVHEWDEDINACCINIPDATQAAALSQQRTLDFFSQAPPFVTRGTTVSSARSDMAQKMASFDASFNGGTATA